MENVDDDFFGGLGWVGSHDLGVPVGNRRAIAISKLCSQLTILTALLIARIQNAVSVEI